MQPIQLLNRQFDIEANVAMLPALLFLNIRCVKMNVVIIVGTTQLTTVDANAVIVTATYSGSSQCGQCPTSLGIARDSTKQ
jgi:hypothetical protein